MTEQKHLKEEPWLLIKQCSTVTTVSNADKSVLLLFHVLLFLLLRARTKQNLFFFLPSHQKHLFLWLKLNLQFVVK